MQALRCEYCGGFINPETYRCEYCGTQYVKPRNGLPIRIDSQKRYAVAKTAPVEIYGINESIPKETLEMMHNCDMPVEDYIRRRFAERIADAIAEKIVIEEYVDYDYAQMNFSARLRIVKPDYRF